jgi:hypothetical protein
VYWTIELQLWKPALAKSASKSDGCGLKPPNETPVGEDCGRATSVSKPTDVPTTASAASELSVAATALVAKPLDAQWPNTQPASTGQLVYDCRSQSTLTII